MQKRLNSRLLGILAVIISLSVAFIVSLSGRTSAADSSYGITITPSSTELSAAPGTSTSSSFSVVNGGSNGYNMTVSTDPYHVSGLNYDPEFTALPGKTDASNWIQINSPATQFLAADKSQTLDYKLNVPADAAPGGYYAVIFAEATPPTKTGVTAINRVGDILYITVQGAVRQHGSLLAEKLPYFVFGSSLNLGAVVQDSGGLHFLTTVNMSASGLTGKQAFSAHLSRFVLPQTERLVSVSWTNLPLIGIYKISRSATILGKVQTLPSHWLIIIRPWLLVCILVVLALAILLISLNLKKKPILKAKTKLKKPNAKR